MKNRTTARWGGRGMGGGGEEGALLGSASGTDAAKMAIVLGQNNKGCTFRLHPI